MSRPAWVAILLVLALCATVDYLDRNLPEPLIPAMFVGIVVSLVIWRADRWLRRRRPTRDSREAG